MIENDSNASKIKYTRHNQRIQNIIPSITPTLRKRDLSTGDKDWFSNIGE
jgi:hypothetical protein